ncbi:MAG: PD-(D/E)XK nuclease family protein [Geodermatophilaceae bacterium]|nr:PD-(D/E)XK nuclease family protein [Geodermatophilaceae bacterium]
MPTRLFGCTPSRLATYAACPRRYRMTYLDRPQPPRGGPWAHSSVGAAVHTVLKRWWELPLPRRTPFAAVGLLRAGWLRDGFRDEAQAARQLLLSSDWVRRYVTGLDPAVPPAGVERTVATTTRRLAVSGRVDRVDQRGDELVVVDYKTGRTAPGPDDAGGSSALALYVLGVRRAYRAACRRVELHHLPTGTVAAFEHTEQSLAGHVVRAEDVADAAVAATTALHAGVDPGTAFPPVLGRHCSWCDLRRHCPEGRRAAPDRRSWEGLAEVPEHADPGAAYRVQTRRVG